MNSVLIVAAACRCISDARWALGIANAMLSLLHSVSLRWIGVLQPPRSRAEALGIQASMTALAFFK